MKQNPVLVSLFVVLTAVGARGAYGWGDLGHATISRIAAHTVGTIAGKDAQSQGMGEFFSNRRVIFAYLANIPDTAWRDSQNRRRIATIDFSSHYLNIEPVVGIPGKNIKELGNKLLGLPANYEELKKLHEGKPNPLPHVGEHRKSLYLYRDFGSAPWRVQQLAKLMVEAFKCAKGKESDPSKAGPVDYTPVEPAFQLPKDRLGEKDEPPLPTYVCKPEPNRKEDLAAAIIMGGIMAHYIEDLAQPYHIPADYDGYITSNGGIHSYFETAVVNALDERFPAEVFSQSTDRAFRGKVLKRINANFDQADGIARSMIQLAWDSYTWVPKVREIDDRVCIKKGPDSRSTGLKWGQYPSEFKYGELKPAQRVPADTAAVVSAYRPILKELFSTATVVISEIWMKAWEKAGKPKLAGQGAMYIPFPHDPPYIWPDFEPRALAESKKP